MYPLYLIVGDWSGKSGQDLFFVSGGPCEEQSGIDVPMESSTALVISLCWGHQGFILVHF